MGHATNRSGGIQVGNAGGDVTFTAGGDIVGRDKETTTGAPPGLASEEVRQRFQAQLDELRDALRSFKVSVEARPELSVEDKESIASAILSQVLALKEIKEKAALSPAGGAAPREFVTSVETGLTRAASVVESAEGLAKKATGFADRRNFRGEVRAAAPHRSSVVRAAVTTGSDAPSGSKDLRVPGGSGIQVGDVGGNATFSALGHIVGGNFTINQTIQVSAAAVTQRPLVWDAATGKPVTPPLEHGGVGTSPL